MVKLFGGLIILRNEYLADEHFVGIHIRVGIRKFTVSFTRAT